MSKHLRKKNLPEPPSEEEAETDEDELLGATTPMPPADTALLDASQRRLGEDATTAGTKDGWRLMAEQIESLRAILLSLVTAVASSPAVGRQIADQLDAAGRGPTKESESAIAPATREEADVLGGAAALEPSAAILPATAVRSVHWTEEEALGALPTLLDDVSLGVFRSIPASKKKTLRDALAEMAEFYDPPTSATRKFMSRRRGSEESPLAYRGALMALALAAYPDAMADHLDPLILSCMLELSQELKISLPVCGHEPLTSRWVARCLDAKFNIKRWDQMAAWTGKPEIDGPPLGWSPRRVVHCSDDSGDDDMLAAAVPHGIPGRRLRDQRGDYASRPRAGAGSSDRRPTTAACFKCVTAAADLCCRLFRQGDLHLLHMLRNCNNLGRVPLDDESKAKTVFRTPQANEDDVEAIASEDDQKVSVDTDDTLRLPHAVWLHEQVLRAEEAPAAPHPTGPALDMTENQQPSSSSLPPPVDLKAKRPCAGSGEGPASRSSAVPLFR
ncbi:unnamed protein product [Lampetra planeri]